MYVIKNVAGEYFTGDRFSPHQRNAKRYDTGSNDFARCLSNDDAIHRLIPMLFGEGARLVHLRPHGTMPDTAA